MIILAAACFPPEPVTSATICYDLALALSEKKQIAVLTPPASRPLGFKFKKRIFHCGKFNFFELKSYTHPRSTLFGRMWESYSYGKAVVKYIKANKNKKGGIYLLVWPLFAEFLIVRAAKKCGIPAITHIVDIYPEALANKFSFCREPINWFLLPMGRYILRHSARVITISPQMKNWLVNTRGINPAKVEVIYTWQDDEIFYRYHRKSPEARFGSLFTFMFLGGLSKTACLANLIHAYHMGQIPNSRLVFAGSGPEKENLVAAARNYPQLNIEFWDAPREKVPEIQAKADVLILSLRKNSARFAMPSKLPAYMFSKKPVISCVEETSDCARVIKSAHCGWIAPAGDPAGLGALLKKVAALPSEELQRHGANGFRYAREHFSRERNLQKLVRVITETCMD